MIYFDEEINNDVIHSVAVNVGFLFSFQWSTVVLLWGIWTTCW